MFLKKGESGDIPTSKPAVPAPKEKKGKTEKTTQTWRRRRREREVFGPVVGRLS